MNAWVKEQGEGIENEKLFLIDLAPNVINISICVTKYNFPSFTPTKIWLKVCYSPLSDTVCCLDKH